MPTPSSSLSLFKNRFLNALQPLQAWASQPHVEQDLERIFGTSINWASAYRHLAAFRQGDFSKLPPISCLPPNEMPGLWGGYSRDLQRIFLSIDCHPDRLSAVLIEEIGHFLDQELCDEETPGDEGAHFTALVLGFTPTASELTLWREEEFTGQVHFQNSPILVEAAAKTRTTTTAKTRPGTSSSAKTRPGSTINTGSVTTPDIVYATKDSVRLVQTTKINQRLVGSKGNDTFVVKDQSVRLEDNLGGKDTVETSVSFDMSKFNFIENLTAAIGTSPVTLGGNSKANKITGNSGDNVLDGGRGSAIDTLIGGAGDDSYVLSDTLDQIVESKGQGSDTILTTLKKASLTDFGIANVENLTFTGTGSATLSGNDLTNVLTGGTDADTLFGSASDSLIGWQGDDFYSVVSQSTRVLELDGPLEGNDTISVSIISTYSMAVALATNVEVLEYKGKDNSSLTGNSGSNTIYGGLLVRNTIDGGAGNDYLFGGDTTDFLFGGIGDDTLVVTQWTDTVLVGSLGTTLRSGKGSDRLNGGEGDDWYVVNSQTAYNYQDTDGTNTIASTVDFSLKYNPDIADNIQNLYLIGKSPLRGTGSDLKNLITGNDGDNRLDAGAGNDTVIAGLGADRIDGQAGDDSLVGGGQPQTDLPANPATPIDLGLRQAYQGKIETRQDTDWIRVSLQAGLTYYFRIIPDFSKSPYQLRVNSDVAFGVYSVNYYDTSDNTDLLGLVGDTGFVAVTNNVGVYDHSLLVLNSDGSRAFGIVDDKDWLHPDGSFGDPKGRTFQENNIHAFSFTPFDSGDFYLPVTGAGPALGKYHVFFSNEISLITKKDEDLLASNAFPEVLADNASDTLIGGLGNDTLVAVAGRDAEGNFLGDILIGGTNGIPGTVDLDSSSKQNITASLIYNKGYYKIESLGTTNWSTLGAATQVVGTIFQATLDGSLLGGSGIAEVPRDSLIGGVGGDLLDAGNGMDLMIGGGGNDTYFIDYPFDIVLEADDGGSDDLAIFAFTAKRNFSTDLAAGYFALDAAATVAGLDSATGAGFDVDIQNDFSNVEHASLVGSANLYVLGNGDSNSLTGNFGNNLLVGVAGDDTLLGQGGNDYLIGGDGGDLLDGGSGQNTMDGGLGADTYIVNDRIDRVINEIAGLDGGEDLIRTYFNFDPIQGSELEPYQPNQPDNSPSTTKAPSFASIDLESFYNLEHFELLGEAVYGVGNALGNSIIAGKSSALLLGMGDDDSLIGNSGDDSLFGDTPNFYAIPDLYAPAPTDTRTKEFMDGIIGSHGSDYLDGGVGDDYLDGGQGFDTMIGGGGTNTFVQDHMDDYVVATGGAANELISSVNIDKAPDGISSLMLVVKEQERDASGNSITGQDQVASFASFLGTKAENDLSAGITVGALSFFVENANTLELLYGTAKAEVFSNTVDQSHPHFISGGNKVNEFVDPNDNTKVAYNLSWSAIDPGNHAEEDPIIGYTISYREQSTAHWRTYVTGSSQDFQGTTATPSLVVDNLASGKTYEFKAEGRRRSVSVTRDASGNATAQLVVTLQGGAGSDQVSSARLIRQATPLQDDAVLDPYIWNNILDPLPLSFLFAPLPIDPSSGMRGGYAAYLDGGFGNDLLVGWEVNNTSGLDYTLQIKQWSADGVTSTTNNITFRGLNTLEGGQGSDTFIVRNGGLAIGDEFDLVLKYDNETPVDYRDGGLGNSLNGGQHNLIASAVPYLTLSDTEVHQGMFIDQLGLALASQFGMGNRLDNYIYDGVLPSAVNTLVGAGGHDSIVGNSSGDVLIGGNAYGLDNVGFSIKDFASVADGGNGLTNSIFRDTDPIPTNLNGPGAADPSQFWSIPGFYKYGEIFDFSKNQDTLVGFATGETGLTLDGGAGADSMVGSSKADTFYVSYSGEHPLNGFLKGNGGGDTVIFTDSDYLWWTGHEEGAVLFQNFYSIDKTDLSNLTLQMGAPTARIAIGNDTANLIIGNEFDNSLDGKGVGASGIDTLVGDGLVRGNLSSDSFIVKDYYRNSTTWKPAVVTTDISTKVETIDPITGVKTTTTIPLFQHEWDPSKSIYLDDDFVVIQDFEAITDFINPITGVRTSGGGNPDNLELKDALSSYSIGNLPTSIESKNLGNIKVGPQGKDITGGEFGIYYTGNQAKWGSGEEVAPNLVAVIQSTDSLLLDRDSDGVFNATLDLDARPSFSLSSDTTSSAVPNPLMGWGQFYQLDTSIFVQYINQPYLMATSNADLSVLMNQIV